MRKQRVARGGAWLVGALLAAGLGLALAALRAAPESRTSALWAAPAGGAPAAPPPESGLSPAAGVRVSGRVLDAQGAPVAGATLVARAASGSAPLTRALSGRAGEFALAVPGGHVQLEARADAHAVALADVLAPARDITLVMAPSASIIGQVVAGDTGAGVPGVLVTASPATGSRAAAGRVPPLSAHSGEDGFFRVEHVPGGAYSLGAASASHAGGPLWVAVAVGQASDAVRLVVVPATRLTARIRVNGEPCSDGEIALSGGTAALAPLEAGVARIDGVMPGSYRLHASCRGALARVEPVVVGGTPVERSWELEPGLTVHGTVQDAEGRAVSGAQVRVSRVESAAASGGGDGGAARCSSGAAGEFACAGLEPGTVAVGVVNERRSLGKPVTLELALGRRASVLLRLDAAGAIRASFAGATPPASPVYARGEDGQPFLGRVAADGVWFEGLPLGHYEVYAGQAGAARARGVELIERGQLVEVRLAPPRLRSIAGRVLDESGLPVRRAWVQAASAAGSARVSTQVGRAALTDDAGRFEIDALPPGDYDITASSTSGEGRARHVSAGTAGLTLAFETFGRLMGTVTTDAGERPPTFVVAYARTGGSGGQVSGKDGHWLLPWVPPGEYRLTITTDAGQARGYAVLPAGGEAQVLTVATPAAH